MTISAEAPDSILPFSGYVGELDYRPVRVVPRSCSVADASRYFATSDIEYLVIHENRIPIGVVNKFDLVRHNMTHPPDPESHVAELMTTQVITVSKDAPVLESLMFMIKHNIQFLLIMSDSEVAGIISQEDWIALQQDYPTELVQSITVAANVDELAALRRDANKAIWRNFETKNDAVSLTRIVTVINDAVTRRVLSLCTQAMIDEGHGDPPCAFAWVGMGSEGRSAQTITTDQDNGLIYDQPEEGDEARAEAWFSELADRVVAGLEACGFDRCAGNAMATNPDLRGPVDSWHRLFRRIITQSEDEDLFEACIYLDFRFLFGKQELVAELREFVMKTIREHPFFLRHLVETTVQGSRPPLRSFRWRVYSATGIYPPPFDIKKIGLMPLDSAVRVLALLEDISATATLERLRRCLESGRISKRLADRVRRAFDFLLRLRFKIEFVEGAKSDHTHLIDLRSLPPAETRYLMDALAAVLELQGFVYEQVVGRKMHWSLR